LAGIRLVPLYERLSIWVVPWLYLAIALCVDAGIRWTRNAYHLGRDARTTMAALLTAAGLWLSGDVAVSGWRAIQVARPDNSNHQLDDRTAVDWLLTHRGDAVLTTRLALAAVWWYADAPVLPPMLGGFLRNGSPIPRPSRPQPAAYSCGPRSAGRAAIACSHVLARLHPDKD
jgi:hypothetical protein